MIQLFRADGIYLGYYHPEYVDLAKLKKYRVEGEKGLFVSAKDVKDAIGTDKWNVLASNETSYIFDERQVVNSPEEFNREKTSIFDHPQHAGIFKVIASYSGAPVKSWLYEDRKAYVTWLRKHRRHYAGSYRVTGYHRIGREWVEDTITT
jgi:hypothetical protein